MRIEAIGPAMSPQRAGYQAMRLVLDAVDEGQRDRRRVIAAARRLAPRIADPRLALYRPGAGRSLRAGRGGALNGFRAFILMVAALRHIAAPRAAVVATLEPVLAAVFAWLIHDEALAAVQIADRRRRPRRARLQRDFLLVKQQRSAVRAVVA